MAAPNHDVIVKVGLTADQYLWLKNEAEESGLSQSAYLRQIVQTMRRQVALSSLSVTERYGDMTEAGPKQPDLSLYKFGEK